MRVLVAYDGTQQAKEALKYGVDRVKEKGGELVTLHVFDSTLFYDYDAVPWAADRARSESAQYLEEAKKIVADSGAGIRTRFELQEGDPEETIIEYAIERNTELLLCPPRYRKIIAEYKKRLGANGKKTSEDSIMDGSDKVKLAVVSVD